MKRPVVVDTTLYIALVALYSMYAVWGLLAAVNGIPTINLVAGVDYQTIWAPFVFFASIATIATIVMRKEYAEYIATIILIALALVYPVAICIQLFTNFTVGRLAILPIALSMMVIPIWRATFLLRQNRKIRG